MKFGRNVADTMELSLLNVEDKPILILDLDNTLFHTYHEIETRLEITTSRPHLDDFLQQVSEKYFLCIFTKATLEYAIMKCTELGIISFIPHERIYSREDTTFLYEKKRFCDVLCSECMKKAIAVDDSPTVWENKNGSQTRIKKWDDVVSWTDGRKKIQAISVIEIPAFYSDMKDDHALSDLGVYMKSCDIINKKKYT